jgi:SAM-dependent methyltransferase
MTPRTTPGTYALDNDDPAAVDRHQYLAEILDDFTRSRLRHVGDLTGRRCLEVGAGGGSVADWLVDQVGPTGRVVATDLNVRHLPQDARYQVLMHDLTIDPLPEGPWDLIHARLVLAHLGAPRDILRRLVAGLAPGGALVIEEWDSSFGVPLLVSPNPEAVELFATYHRHLREVLAASGNDLTWPKKVHAAMTEEGLVEVDTAFHARAWPGGSAGARLHAINASQLHAELQAAGFTDVHLDQLRTIVDDPRTVVRGLITTSTIGRRPPAGA